MRVYVWVENEQLFTTEDKNLAPSEAIEFEVEDFNDIVYDGSQIRLKTQDEKLQELRAQKFAELKAYVAFLLAPSDYVIIKIAEAQVRGNVEEVEMLKQKYAEQLQRREAVRVWNEQMKQVIENATSLEELRNLVIEFNE